jgi:glycosyltransferase involved in cell wall biosynthesis
VTVHAVFRNEGVHYPGLRAKLRYKQFGFMARRAIAGVDRYVPSSAYVAREMTEVAHKFHDVVENPIEQRYFDVPDQPVAGRLLFAGTIYHRKGIEVLIESAAGLKERGVDFRLHIAGSIGDKAYHAGLLEQVERTGLGNDVIFRGFLTEEELTREFSEADLVVLPSYAETSPMTVQQAMAAGKPVVATRVGGIPQLIEDGASGLLVDAGDVASMTDALVLLRTDPDLRLRMGAHAKQEAEERFSVRSVAAKNLEIYRQLLKGGFAT